MSEQALPEVSAAFWKVIEGLRLVGDGLTMIIRYVLVAFGVQVPDIAVRVAALLVMMLAVWRYGRTLSKIILVALSFVLASMAAGIIGEAASYLSTLFSAFPIANIFFW